MKLLLTPCDLFINNTASFFDLSLFRRHFLLLLQVCKLLSLISISLDQLQSHILLFSFICIVLLLQLVQSLDTPMDLLVFKVDLSLQLLFTLLPLLKSDQSFLFSLTIFVAKSDCMFILFLSLHLPDTVVCKYMLIDLLLSFHVLGLLDA